MKILADANIPYVEEAFESLGDVQRLHGREIDRAAVKNADCLLVRTTTQVDKSLLHGSKVKFVASATSGFDHVDRAYLEASNIPFHYAPGSNAESVAQYIVAAILHLCITHGRRPDDLRLGIVGHGRVGKRVEHMARALNMTSIGGDRCGTPLPPHGSYRRMRLHNPSRSPHNPRAVAYTPHGRHVLSPSTRSEHRPH